MDGGVWMDGKMNPCLAVMVVISTLLFVFLMTTTIDSDGKMLIFGLFLFVCFFVRVLIVLFLLDRLCISFDGDCFLAHIVSSVLHAGELHPHLFGNK